MECKSAPAEQSNSAVWTLYTAGLRQWCMDIVHMCRCDLLKKINLLKVTSTFLTHVNLMKGNEQKTIRSNSLLREVVKCPVGFLNGHGHYLWQKNASLSIQEVCCFGWRWRCGKISAGWQGEGWAGEGRGEDWISMWPLIRQTAMQPARHIRVCWRYAIGTLRGCEPRKEIERFLCTAREPQIAEWRTGMKAPEWELFASPNSFQLCVSMFLLLLLCVCPFYCYVTSAIQADTPYLLIMY